MIVYGQISCICLHANKGRESKTKDSVYNAHLNFQTFLQWEKSAHYTQVNTIPSQNHVYSDLEVYELTIMFFPAPLTISINNDSKHF